VPVFDHRIDRWHYFLSAEEISVTKRKLLVVDDSKVIRTHVRQMLAAEFEVLEAIDGLEGLNLIRQEHPGLIMLDFLLPRLSGWDVFQALQQEPDLKTIPLVLMSGRKQEVTDKIPEPFQGFEFIEKPFEQKQLFAAIQSATVKAKLRQLHAKRSEVKATDEKLAEIAALNARIDQMQVEMDSLKKAMGQLVGVIRQKLK